MDEDFEMAVKAEMLDDERAPILDAMVEVGVERRETDEETARRAALANMVSDGIGFDGLFFFFLLRVAANPALTIHEGDAVTFVVRTRFARYINTTLALHAYVFE
jgi:hypothetical protein